MNLLYDLTATQPSQGKFHGAGEYAKTVFDAVVRSRGRNRIFGCYLETEWLDEAFIGGYRDSITLVPLRSLSEIPDIITRNAIDRFYSALPYKYAGIDISPAEFAFTIHGLRDIEMPTDRDEIRYATSLGDMLRFAVKQLMPGWYRSRCVRATRQLALGLRKRILVPTLHTRYSLLSVCPELSERDIPVYYSPEKIVYRKSPTTDCSALAGLGLARGGYILLSGANRWIKNTRRAGDALREMVQSGIVDRKIVVTGVSARDRYWKFFGPHVVALDYVDDALLEQLYRNAWVFVYPSLNEGFGYPPLEAMKYGVPVIASAIASIPEVCADGALYVSPYHGDEIRNRIIMLQQSHDIYREYSRRAKQRYRMVSAEQRRMLRMLVRDLLRS